MTNTVCPCCIQRLLSALQPTSYQWPLTIMQWKIPHKAFPPLNIMIRDVSESVCVKLFHNTADPQACSRGKEFCLSHFIQTPCLHKKCFSFVFQTHPSQQMGYYFNQSSCLHNPYVGVTTTRTMLLYAHNHSDCVLASEHFQDTVWKHRRAGRFVLDM